MKRLALICAFMFTSFPVLSQQISKNFTVKTTIDRNELFASDIKAKFTKEHLYPEYIVSTDSVAPVYTSLVVTGYNMTATELATIQNHVITLSDNQSRCYVKADASSEDTPGSGLALIPVDTDDYGEKFVSVWFENVGELTKENELSLPFQNNENGELSAIHPVTLKFGTLPEVGTDVIASCDGEVAVMVGFDV